MRLKLLILSIASGILLGLPWHNYFPGLLSCIGFIPLLFVEDCFSKKIDKSSFYDLFHFSFLAFLIWNITATYWLKNSGFISAIIVILTNTMAMSVTFGLFHLVKKQFNNKIGFISLIIFWISFEYIFLNTHLTWPWLNLGNALSKDLKLIQWYEYTGVHGGSLWVLSVNILLFNIIKKDHRSQSRQVSKKTLSIFLFVFIAPIIISLYLFKTYKEEGNDVNFISIQPNLDAYTEKYTIPQNQQTQLLLELSLNAINCSTDYVICPETSISKEIWEHQLNNDSSIQKIKNITDQFPRLTYILGISTKQKIQDSKKHTPGVKYDSIAELYYQSFNAASQIDTSKNIPLYYKSKLVSGVETMPFLWLFGFLENLIFDFGGTKGTLGFQQNREVFQNVSTEVILAPIICYESAFGEFVSDFTKQGANIFSLITNDGWWGNSPGHEQHLRLSQIRAIENRRSIARSANTGISAFINQRGEIIEKTKYNEKSVISNVLKTNSKITFYCIFGDYIGRISLFISILIILFYIVNIKLKK